jgi:aminopeptidase N
MPVEDMVQIARHDSDLFSRWQAINQLAIRDLLKAVKEMTAGATQVAVDAELIAILRDSISDDSLEPAFRAQIMALPSEADIAREIGKDIDPEMIHAARNAVMAAVAAPAGTVLAAILDAPRSAGAFSPDAASAGIRALRNAALTWMSYCEPSPDRAAKAFAEADNMTELAHALSVLAHRFSETEAAKQAVAAFGDRFAENALVLDKWFSIQATVPGPATLASVEALMQSPRFAAGNPNRLRSLIGSFAMANPTGFHRKDGAGYAFLANQIIAIDKRNPQVAARILTSMRSWRSLEPTRAALARSALVTIGEASPLSTDVRDLVDRMLEA